MVRIWQNIAIYALAFACGAVLSALSVPLSWLIGALVAGAAIRLGGAPLPLYPPTRQMGQVLIGATVGLAFTHEALAATMQLVTPMVAAGLLTIACGMIAATILVRVARMDMISASLASMPLGPVESATLALHHGLTPAPIIFAQCLRIVMLVTIIPPVVFAFGGAVPDPSAVFRAAAWTWDGSALLVVLAAAGGFTAKLVRFPNPFFNGPCAAGVAAMLLDLPVSPLPYPAIIAGQMLMGVWLGAVFDRAFLSGAVILVLSVLLSTTVLILLCLGLGLAIGGAVGLPWQVMVLATAPGGVAEMALTAKMLQEGVAVVISFHLVRIFIIQLLSPVIFGITARLLTWWEQRGS